MLTGCTKLSVSLLLPFVIVDRWPIGCEEKGNPYKKAGGKGTTQTQGPYRGWGLPRVEERSLLTSHTESVEPTGGSRPREASQPLSNVSLCLMKLPAVKDSLEGEGMIKEGIQNLDMR